MKNTVIANIVHNSLNIQFLYLVKNGEISIKQVKDNKSSYLVNKKFNNANYLRFPVYSINSKLIIQITADSENITKIIKV